MNLHTDLPTRAQIDRLMESRHPCSVSVYLAVARHSDGHAERTELRNHAYEARRQLEEAEAARADLHAIDEAFAELSDDDEFWGNQARSLAVLATPESLVGFRLANR